jgi:hypothetical protein
MAKAARRPRTGLGPASDGLSQRAGLGYAAPGAVANREGAMRLNGGSIADGGAARAIVGRSAADLRRALG